MSLRIETIVLAANTDGLAFARGRGFVDLDRYTIEEDGAEYVDLMLAPGVEADAR